MTAEMTRAMTSPKTSRSSRVRWSHVDVQDNHAFAVPDSFVDGDEIFSLCGSHRFKRESKTIAILSDCPECVSRINKRFGLTP